MTIAVLLVPANLKVRKETLNSFIERHAMLSELVALEVVLEIRWSKPTPVDHGSFYRAVVFSGIRCRPSSRQNCISRYACEGRSVAPGRASGNQPDVIAGPLFALHVFIHSPGNMQVCVARATTAG